MRRLAATATQDIAKVSATRWRRSGGDPAFDFAIVPARGAFICFFLRAETSDAPPRIALDEGSGFNEPAALQLKAFPFAFYHLPLDRMPTAAKRLRFHPGGTRAPFGFVAFQTSKAPLVAALHYLFNLRYQNIGIVAPGANGWQRAGATLRRIIGFFRDVSRGQGLRVQEGSEKLGALKLVMSLKALELRRNLPPVDPNAPPLLSFVTPVFNTRPEFLRDLVDSFAREAPSGAELILVDDGSAAASTLDFLRAITTPRVSVVFKARNEGIAATTNAGIAAARGAYVAFIDHDDALVSGAVAVIVDAIARHPHALFFYTDEIVTDAALTPIGAFCKPAYDSVLLSGLNYINHLSIFRRDRLDAIGRLREDREGSQDYDLLLRYLSQAPVGSIVHIPYPAYLWRRSEGSYSHKNLVGSVASARAALVAAYAACCREVRVEPAIDTSLHRVRFVGDKPRPRVSVIIPNRDSPALIRRVVGDLLYGTAYAPLDIVIVDNGTTDATTLAFYRELRDRPEITIDILAEPFNFAAMCNRGARLAKGDALLFLNNDIEVRDDDWLAEMVECLAFAATGIVGARLLFPDGRVQHNGVIVGLGEAAGHWYDGAAADDPGPMGRLLVRLTLSAVTAACMLVTRSCFEALGGFDEEHFAIAYNDVDFCMRARAKGFRTIWTPFATLTHHESASRGSDAVGANNARFRQEMARLQERHDTKTLIDDAYSPFYDRRESKPHLIVPDALPAPRPNVLS